MTSTHGIGIDFGATTCVVAMSKNGQTDVIPNELGSRVTQACVAFTEAERMVGDAAYNQKERNVKGTLSQFKRLLGKEFEDEGVQEDLAEFEQFKNIKIVPSSSSTCAIELPFPRPGDEEEGPEQLSLESCATMVLEKIKETAESFLGESVSHCVMSVPSHYSVEDAEILKKCCEETGIKVMRLVKEPVAAMICYGLDRPASSCTTASSSFFAQKNMEKKTVVVVDLGGSTFDVSVMHVNAAGSIRSLGSSGAGTFGAKSFDDVLYDFCVKDLRRKDRKSAEQLKSDDRAKMRLRDACSAAKKALSASKSASIEVEALIGDIDFSAQLSRQAFEDLVEQSEKLETITEILEEALLEEAKLDIATSKIHSVLLIGGGSNIPKVKSAVESWFAEKKFGGQAQPLFLTGEGTATVLPEEAVALGAAIQADLLLNDGDTFGSLKTTCELVEEEPTTAGEDDDDETPGTIAQSGMVLQATIGISVGAEFFPVIPQGSAVPCVKKQKFGANASWENVALDISEKAGTNVRKIAKMVAPVHGKAFVDVEFKVSKEGVLTIESGDKVVVAKK